MCVTIHVSIAISYIPMKRRNGDESAIIVIDNSRTIYVTKCIWRLAMLVRICVTHISSAKTVAKLLTWLSTHKKDHVCHKIYCKTCKEFYAEDHQCYMQPVSNENSSKKQQRKRDMSNTFSLTLSVPRTMFLNVSKVTLKERMGSANIVRNHGVVHFNIDPTCVLYIRSVTYALTVLLQRSQFVRHVVKTTGVSRI